MNIKKLMVVSGSLVLAAAAVFAGGKKASHNKSVVHTLFYTAGANCRSIQVPNNSNFTTNSNSSSNVATIRTRDGGGSKALHTTNCSGAAVYFVPA